MAKTIKHPLVSGATPIYAWHFVSSDRKLRDGRPLPEVGEWLKHKGELALCTSGLHASVEPLDALRYAPGSIVCRVVCSGEIVHSDDKLVCSKRKILTVADATEELRSFARWCALQAADRWKCPAVVREWLVTGDECLRDAAESAAWSAARTVATAARTVALTAASSESARSAASSAAWSARPAMSAAWSARPARSAARSAEFAAWSAAMSAGERKAQNEELKQRLLRLLGLEELKR